MTPEENNLLFEETQLWSDLNIFILIFSFWSVKSNIWGFIVIVFYRHLLLFLWKSFHDKLSFGVFFIMLILFDLGTSFWVRNLSVWRTALWFMIKLILVLIFLVDFLKIIFLILYLMRVCFSKTFGYLQKWSSFRNSWRRGYRW